MSSHTQQDEHLDAVITGKISASDNLAAFLAALDKTEDDIKAWCLRSDTRAHAQAEACDAAPVRGALHGVCVGVKDIIDTADMLTERGSRSCAGRQPDKDADLVSALRAAGAILPGKTATTEFAYLDKTVTRNPHNLAHSPGGSSSGSAAAIAAGQIPLAIGTQTGGSVIRPASYCGVFGMKPSFGSISRAGVLQTSQTLDQVGVFASTLTGIGRLCDVIMTGAEGMMQATQSACDNPRCLVFDGLYDGIVESGVQDAVSSVTASLGAAVTHIPAPEMIASYLAGHKAVYHVELAQNLGAICDAKSALVGPAAKATVAIGGRIIVMSMMQRRACVCVPSPIYHPISRLMMCLLRLLQQAKRRYLMTVQAIRHATPYGALLASLVLPCRLQLDQQAFLLGFSLLGQWVQTKSSFRSLNGSWTHITIAGQHHDTETALY